MYKTICPELEIPLIFLLFGSYWIFDLQLKAPLTLMVFMGSCVVSCVFELSKIRLNIIYLLINIEALCRCCDVVSFVF